MVSVMVSGAGWVVRMVRPCGYGEAAFLSVITASLASTPGMRVSRGSS
jgi:hypothetical protein